MRPVFWTGRLSPAMKLMVNANSLVAWVGGSGRDALAMKNRVGQGYEGAFTEHVRGYDQYALDLTRRAAAEQLARVDVQDKEVLDVGCGTGVLSVLALEQGAAHVIGSDVSAYMLDCAREKAAAQGVRPERVVFEKADAESLPYADASFGVVLSSLVLGMLPDQRQAVAEMTRVTRPGGSVVVGAQGPEYLWEAMDAGFRSIDKRSVLAYRPEWWPLTERKLRSLFDGAGLDDVRVERVTWKNRFDRGGQAWDCFAAISGAFWYERFTPEGRMRDADRAREHFERKGVTELTEDIIVASARKP